MKKFMTAFTVIAAGFAANTATAALPSSETPSAVSDLTNQLAETANAKESIYVRNDAGDQFSFVLKRSTETGQLMALHESHASHASHESHRSHYSSSN